MPFWSPRRGACLPTALWVLREPLVDQRLELAHLFGRKLAIGIVQESSEALGESLHRRVGDHWEPVPMPLLNCGAKPIALPVVKPLVREIEQPLRLCAEVFEFGHTDTATNLQRSRSQARVRVSPQQQAHSGTPSEPTGRS